MRRSRLLFSLLAVSALVAVGGTARAFSVSSSAGLNVGSTTSLRDPDEQVDRLANGAGPESSAHWADRAMGSLPGTPAPAATAPVADRWSRSWPAPSLIIGSRWAYPPDRP